MPEIALHVNIYDAKRSLMVRSRRLQSLPPLDIGMSEVEEKPRVQATTFTCLQHPRSPPNFSGKATEFAHLWLKDFNRVALYNGWDETMCLANVVFFLEGTAKYWFDNIEDDLTSWAIFKEKFSEMFGDKEDYSRKIESALKVRAQKPDESIEFYIQEVLNLCRQLNPNMSEEDRVGHLMKGVSDDIYRILLTIEVATTVDFTNHCRWIEKLNKKRISSVRFERIPSVATIKNEEAGYTLKDLIREIVKEELRLIPNEQANSISSKSLEEKVLQRAEQSLSPIEKAPVVYSRKAFQNFRRDKQEMGEATKRRKTDQFRMEDNIPICFYCNRPGHVAKHCWERRRNYQEREPSIIQDSYYSRRRPGPIYMSDFITPQLDDFERSNSPRRNLPRSSSPYPERGRSTTGRYQSRSPPFSPQKGTGKLGNTTCKGGKVGRCFKPPQTRADLDENYICININGRHVEALIDTGASYSVISANFRESLKVVMIKNTNITLKVANNRFVSPLGECLLRVGINEFQRTAEFLVLPSCSHDVILGWDFLESSSAIIDCGQSEISFSEMPNEDPSVARLYLASDDIIPPKSIKRGSRKLLLEKELFIPSSYVTIWHGRVTNFSKNQIPIPSGMCLAQFIKIQPQEICPIVEANENYVSKGVESTYKMSSIENLTNIDNAERPVGMENISSCISPELPPSHKIELLELLERFLELFNPITKSESELITKHKIATGDARPLKRRPYRVSPSERNVIHEEVDRMMEIRVVQPSKSPWASPVVLVRKRDRSVRFCVDYRGLDEVTKKDVYPLPRVDDALDCLKGAKIYSTMDLKSGYWQISVDESDREKTAFITPDGLFEFKVMPFGLCNAPATFERMMDGLLKGLRWTICLCYLDDVVVFADNFSDHLARIEAVLNCFKKVGLRLNPSKCSFGASKIKILGHQVDQNGIRPDDEKIKAITEFPAPNNLQQVRSFLGLSSYYRRFIRNYADIARPLNALLSKGTKFEWNTAQEGAFRKLKIALTSKLVLGHFDDDAPTELHTDARRYGIGAMLAQKQGSDEKVIVYASRTLLRAEQNYSTTERECLAIIWAIGKFRPYLFPIPPPDSPFQKVGIDILRRFPISQGKKKWIVVCTDYLTKYAVTQSLGSGEALEIAKFLLEEVILKHGAPREIAMDRGRNFQSKLLQELTNKCGIKKKTTTAYHPLTNSLTERLNRTIADMLLMYMDLDQKNWDEMLPFITFAYNTAEQKSTGFTPFFLIHGREAETTLDTIFPYSSSSEGEEFIQNLGTRAEEARQIARHHIFKAQETNKTNYDARHTGKIYEPGDLVWIFISIQRKISDVTYEVKAVSEQGRRQKKRDTVHILRIPIKTGRFVECR
ncbi:hypothetical protein LAZ67_9001766 [Cordylochernes scorpioides]|uniref:Endonuclease n=1 Tax=Cordylochernes scorpioides TaxID=51811 RepID=A0ABY6KTY1_9ARAC|nr:hypothetical protein LAZ67_9001766 [Cordylochernes scorpioides]